MRDFQINFALDSGLSGAWFFFLFLRFCPSIFSLGANQFCTCFGVFLLPSGVVFQFFLEMAGDESLEIWLTMVAVVAMDAMVLMDAMIE